MALRITQKTGLVIVFIAFTTNMVRTESGVSGDVPDDVVYTDLHKTVYEGDSVVLTCRFRGTPLAVWWKKGDDPRTAPNLVSWIPSDNVTGKCEGERPCQIMEMNEDRSLVIKEVSIAEQGRYICRVTIKGILIHNFTDIIVFFPPQSPFPTIDQCSMLADDRGTESCILTQEAGADYTELTCRTTGEPRGVVSLSWTLGGTTTPLQEPHRSTNPDGVTEDVMVAIGATPSAAPYVCVAILHTTTRRQATMSVTVNRAPIVTTIEAVTTKNITVSPPKPINKRNTVIIISTVCALSVTILIIILAVFIWRGRTNICKLLKSSQTKNEGPVSYLELWELVETCDVVVLDDIVSTLVGNPERELEYDFERSKADLYSELCEWKDKTTRDVKTLYAAIEENGLDLELKIIKDFRARTDKMVSLDDLEHICWHVQGCKKTVQPVLRALYSHNENITKFPGDTQTSGNSRSDVIKNDIQLMKTWRENSMTANPEEEVETVKTRQPSSRGIWCGRKLQTNQHAGDSYERTPMYSAGSEDVDLGAQTLPPNRMVQVCLALDEAGRRANESDKLVYHQLAKTFFQSTRNGKVAKKDLEPAAQTEADTRVEGPSQNSEDKKSSGKEATDTKNVDAEKSREDNPSTKEQGAKHGASQNSEEIKSSGKGATDTKNVDAEISREENARTKEQDAKRGKENDGASEEEANINKNITDGEQLSIYEDWFVVPREDVMQEKIGDGSAEPDKNATENVDTKEQGSTPDGSDERKRDDSSETRRLVPAELDHWGQPIESSQYMDPATAGYQAFI